MGIKASCDPCGKLGTNVLFIPAVSVAISLPSVWAYAENIKKEKNKNPRIRFILLYF
jgi:hypothetical protein